jgi:hypothetical protein
MLIKFIPAILAILSSILEIIGAYLLYKFAIPPHTNLFSGAFMNDGSKIKDEQATNRRYADKTTLGFRLLATGFVIQLVANVLNILSVF